MIFPFAFLYLVILNISSCYLSICFNYIVCPWLCILLKKKIIRFVWRCLETCLFPHDVVRAVMEHKLAIHRGEGFLVSWSRSTSTSSIFR